MCFLSGVWFCTRKSEDLEKKNFCFQVFLVVLKSLFQSPFVNKTFGSWENFDFGYSGQATV